MTMKWEIPPQQAMMMGPVGMIFSEGLKFYLASTDEAMVMTQGGDMTMLNEVLAASGGSGEMQSRAAIENLRGKLESQRFVEGYVDLAEATRTVMGLMNTMMPGMVPPIQVPEDVPPMGFSVSLGDNALGGQAYLPVKTTMAIKDVSMQMAMMAAGPRGGGPGMGGPGQMDIEMDEPAEQDMSESTDTESDGKVTALTSSDFNEAVNDGVVLVDFWATWCAPCRRQGPIVESLAGAYGEQAGFAKVDIDANGQLAARFQIRAIPTLILFRDGEEVERFVGLTSRNDLATAINKALGN
jgi:thioredoxin 1